MTQEKTAFPLPRLLSLTLGQTTNIAVQQQIKVIFSKLQVQHGKLGDTLDAYDTLIELLNEDYGNVNDAGNHRKGAAYKEALNLALDVMEEERNRVKTGTQNAAPTNGTHTRTHGLTRSGSLPDGEKDSFEPNEFYSFRRASGCTESYGLSAARQNLLRYASQAYAEQTFGTPVTMPTPKGNITVRIDPHGQNRKLAILGSSVDTLLAYAESLMEEAYRINPTGRGRFKHPPADCKETTRR